MGLSGMGLSLREGAEQRGNGLSIYDVAEGNLLKGRA